MANILSPGCTLGPVMDEADYPRALDAMAEAILTYPGPPTILLRDPTRERRAHFAAAVRDSGRFAPDMPSHLLFREPPAEHVEKWEARGRMSAPLSAEDQSELAGLFRQRKHEEVAHAIRESPSPVREFRNLFVSTLKDAEWQARFMWYLEVLVQAEEANAEKPCAHELVEKYSELPDVFSPADDNTKRTPEDVKDEEKAEVDAFFPTSETDPAEVRRQLEEQAAFDAELAAEMAAELDAMTIRAPGLAKPEVPEAKPVPETPPVTAKDFKTKPRKSFAPAE